MNTLDGLIVLGAMVGLYVGALALIGFALFKLPSLYGRLARRLFGIKETHQSDAP